MAPSTLVQTANGPTLKRSFPTAAIANPPNQERGALLETGRRIDGQQVQAQAPKRRQSRDNRFTNMPSAAGPRNYENHIPSFMSVYGMDANMTDSSAAGGPGMKFAGTTSYSTPQSNAPIPQHQTQQTQEAHDKSLAQPPTHQSRESTSTQASDSTDSSPTTTISTVDSCSLSDPSPSSSPESPITLVPLSSFASTAFSLDQFSNLKMADNSTTTTIRPPASDERPMTSPSPRRWKNPKSLALNLNSGSDSYSQTSEPSSPSPSFIKPPTPMARRKPSLLSLNTGAANQNFLAAPLAPLGNLASPGLHARRSLKHSMSSPQIISTPSFGPKGGMTFGDRGVSRLGMGSVIHEDSPLEGPGVQMATRVAGVDVGGDEFDRRRFIENDDSDGYPDGPILMQEPSVHLYSEPKLEEAMKFDVIFNVAREVRNPFAAAEERRESTKSEPTMTPSTALSSFSFKTAFEFQPSGYDSTPETPTTPKAMDHRPEYIHLPWDHNTNITDQLWDLCEKIDARVKEGKKVLVHCQQGASRSATLIIAYIMYKNPDWTQDRARDEAKARSQWVNPNMSLLFCLNDFKKIVDEKKGEKKDVVKPLGHRPTLSADSTLNVEAPPTPSRARGNSTPSAPTPDRQTRPAVEDAPASDSKTIRTLNSFDFGFSAIPSIPKRDVDDWESSALMSPRVTEMTSNPLQQAFNFSRPLAPAIFEEPPTPGLFSPRTTEFPRSAFFHSPIASPPPVEDPRSPPTKGEAPIIRSIDDLL